jgi:cell wall-associated NlpC family hydrolase
VTPVDLSLLDAVYKNMAHRVQYGFGDKAPSLDCDSHVIRTIDCSGFVRYAIARATGQATIMPDGSVAQHDWCEAVGLRQLSRYSDVQYAKEDPARLFVAFIEPCGPRPGHVWMVRAGKTMESHGGVGVDSRHWNHLALVRSACAAYELPAKE